MSPLPPAASSNVALEPAEGWPGTSRRWLLAITGVAIALRLFRIEAWSFDAGEAATYRAITLPLDGADGYFADPASLAPLVHLCLRWLVEHVLPGNGEGWLRLPFAFAGVLAVPALAVLLRRLVGAPAALVAAGVLALHPLHVALSQSMSPVVVGVTAALLAGLVPVRSRVLTLLPFVVAIGCAPELGFAAMAAVACRLREPVRRALLLLLVPVAVVVWSCSVAALGLPLVLLAGAALAVVRPDPRLVLFAVVPTAGLAGLALARGERLGDGLLVLALPGMAGLAAVLLVPLFGRVREHGIGSARLRQLAAALPGLLAVTWLGVDVFLHLTAYQGQRAPWRKAVESVFASLGPRGVVVAAQGGVGPLLCYLRPNHWRQLDRDLHPAIGVVPIRPSSVASDLDLAAATRPGAVHWLVLQVDELAALQADPALAERLRRFRQVRVVQAPRAHGDDTLVLLRADAP
ncbi:MAG: hypothetical protein JNK15_05625 [Planctomycetes bacterium]|nr:hypothetical protein [Planctomycetota bacterium]